VHDLRRIVLATDLGADAPDLFAHALALALRARAELFLLHVDDPEHPEATWRRLPTVRALLERWGHLAVGADPEAFSELGLRVHALERPRLVDLRTVLTTRIAHLRPDLLVLGTHARTGFDRLLRGSVAEPVARDVHRATLFVRHGAHGIVDPETGALRLRRVLVPVTDAVPQQALVDELVRLVAALGASPVSFTMVHVGTAATLPRVRVPERTDWLWRTDLRAGGVVEQLLQAEVEHDVDLVAMATHGHDSFADAILGSKTERLLRRGRCPVFVVPVR